MEPDNEEENQIFSILIYYGRADLNPPVLYDYPYGVFGIGRKGNIISSYKELVESAMTDFIKANFDL